MIDERNEPTTLDWDEFAPLYDAHERRLYRLALLLHNGDEAAAEEDVAGAFVHCYDAWAAGRVDDVLRYARSALVAGVLARARSGRGSAGEASDRPAFQLLARLPVAERMAIVLRYYEDLSDGEIAEMMGVPVGDVGAYVDEGLRQLRHVP
jgi:DNA-directed RNA polymerase specialized sigma24 family protein